jgi:uncharacterized membrane protein YecN with MAPEG domain
MAGEAAMAEERGPAEAVDMASAERAIRRAGLVATVAALVAGGLAVVVLPRVFVFPEALDERLAFGAQAGLLVLVWVLAGVGMVSTTRRRSPADIGGAAAGPPSPRLAIPAAFLQNTLEQAVLAAGLYLALATLVSGAWLATIPVAVVFFAVGRVLFLRGYARGVEGRALGMTLTMVPTLLGYAAAVGLVGWRIVVG